MMYQDKMVAVVVVGGSILREVEPGVIQMPFGSDYGLRLKNLEGRQAVVGVSIDGDGVMGGNRLVVDAGDSVDLQGFMGADGAVRQSFRFIQKTSEVVEHRGDRLDDGIVRVEWQVTSPVPQVVVRHETVVRDEVVIHKHHHHHDYYPYWPYYPQPHPFDQRPGIWCSSGPNSMTLGQNASSGQVQCSAMSTSQPSMAIPAQNEGITVRGAQVGQDFNDVGVGRLEEESHVLILRLVGVKSTGKKVVEAVQSREKVACPTCGKKARQAKFCSGCGTALS